jgi:hypothetical protein
MALVAKKEGASVNDFWWLRRRLAVRCAACLLAFLLGLQPAFARRGGDDDNKKPLKLRVNDAVGKPGGAVAIVLRTYAARPIRQGQLRVKIRRAAALATLAAGDTEALEAGQPLARLVSVTVYSSATDTSGSSAMATTSLGQNVDLDFRSPSGTVNASDGPLAVLRFVLSSSAKPGEVYSVEIDPGIATLLAANGAPIAVEPINATLRVRAANSPQIAEVEGDKISPGETALLGFQTTEPTQLSGGKITFLYSAAIAAGKPTVRIDPRYGKATFTTNTAVAGRLIVNFTSPDKTLNRVPGLIIAVSLPIKAAAPVGSRTSVRLDPANTRILNRAGRPLAFLVEPGVIEIR